MRKQNLFSFLFIHSHILFSWSTYFTTKY